MKYKAALATGAAMGSGRDTAIAFARKGAKHGPVGLTHTAALEYAARGIRVNAVCPGFILTPMLKNAGLTADEESLQPIVALHPAGRLGAPREVADALSGWHPMKLRS